MQDGLTLWGTAGRWALSVTSMCSTRHRSGEKKKKPIYNDLCPGPSLGLQINTTHIWIFQERKGFVNWGKMVLCLGWSFAKGCLLFQENHMPEVRLLKVLCWHCQSLPQGQAAVTQPWLIRCCTQSARISITAFSIAVFSHCHIQMGILLYMTFTSSFYYSKKIVSS